MRTHGLMSYRRFGRAWSLRSDRTLVRARSLRSNRAPARSLRSNRAPARAPSLHGDRAPDRARSLRSDRAEWTFGRYVATEPWLELSRYVATGRSSCLVAAKKEWDEGIEEETKKLMRKVDDHELKIRSLYSIEDRLSRLEEDEKKNARSKT
ncbi:hypothetical protein F2Q69_00043419 [Brassica cretica]|uniref:Uncharacterized protein n=1 Tax=Brassica cretica TaxID=69181 RepID=A0A8S9N5L0_BRACR|nr:hypothetical protein F2Q69_00043419 [Brassica cretica]